MKKITAALVAILVIVLTSETFGQTPVPSNSKQNPMKEYVLLIRLKENPYTPEEFKIVNERWANIVGQWKADGRFVTSFIFPSESYVLSGSARNLKKESVVHENLRVVSSIVLRAASFEEITELAKVAPVLDYGGTVEIREVQVPKTPPPANK